MGRNRQMQTTSEASAALTEALAGLPYAAAAYAAGSGRLLAANTRFQSAFTGLPVSDLSQLQAILETVITQDGASEVRSPHDGRWYSLHYVSGPALQMISAIDISERVEALASRTHQQEKLLFTSRMMSVGEMAATLAHELNQPLAAIINYLNGSLRLLDQADTPSPRIADALASARVQAEHAAAVISRVREFVRARAPRRDAHDMIAIVHTVVELLRLEAERLQLRIDLALAPDLPVIYADKVMIEQVLLNLVKNAIESMRDAPTARRALRIEGRRTLDDEVEVRVLDRGSGLSPAQQEQVFSPFFTTKHDGLGIGLAICRSIIEYHEGRLFFEAREDGGSVFGFTLPLAQGVT